MNSRYLLQLSRHVQTSKIGLNLLFNLRQNRRLICRKYLRRHLRRSWMPTQGFTQRPFPGCENAAGKLRQKWWATAGTQFTIPGNAELLFRRPLYALQENFEFQKIRRPTLILNFDQMLDLNHYKTGLAYVVKIWTPYSTLTSFVLAAIRQTVSGKNLQKWAVVCIHLVRSFLHKLCRHRRPDHHLPLLWESLDRLVVFLGVLLWSQASRLIFACLSAVQTGDLVKIQCHLEIRSSWRNSEAFWVAVAWAELTNQFWLPAPPRFFLLYNRQCKQTPFFG